MAEEIGVGFDVSRHPVNNPNGVRQRVTFTNGIFIPEGWLFRASEHAEYNICIPYLPKMNATPNGKIRVLWTTAVAGTNAVKFYIKLREIIHNNASYTWDPSSANFTASLDSSVTTSSLGAALPNISDLAIPGAMLAQGRGLVGTIRRNDADAADTLSGEIIVPKVIFVADS